MRDPDGANGDFCSGADIVKSGGTDPGWEGSKLTAMRQLAESVVAVHDCPVPVIAKVRRGGRRRVRLGARRRHAVVLGPRPQVAVFAKLGLSLDYGSSWLLGKRSACTGPRKVALTRRDDGRGPHRRGGLANAVVPADELDEVVAGVAKRIADGPPMALSMTKRMLDNAAASSLIQALETGSDRPERQPGHGGPGRRLWRPSPRSGPPSSKGR